MTVELSYVQESDSPPLSLYYYECLICGFTVISNFRNMFIEQTLTHESQHTQDQNQKILKQLERKKRKHKIH